MTATATHVYSRMNLNVRNLAADDNNIAQPVSKSAGSTDLFTSILGIFGHSAKEAIKNEVNKLGNAIKNEANKVGDKIKGALKEVDKHLSLGVAVLGAAGSMAGEDIKHEVQKIPQKLHQAGKDIENAFNSVGTAISGTVNTAVGGLVNSAAQTIVHSVQKGIEDGVQTAIKEVESVVKDKDTPTGQAVGTIIQAAETVIKDIAQSNEAASRNPVQPTSSF